MLSKVKCCVSGLGEHRAASPPFFDTLKFGVYSENVPKFKVCFHKVLEILCLASSNAAHHSASVEIFKRLACRIRADWPARRFFVENLVEKIENFLKRLARRIQADWPARPIERLSVFFR